MVYWTAVLGSSIAPQYCVFTATDAHSWVDRVGVRVRLDSCPIVAYLQALLVFFALVLQFGLAAARAQREQHSGMVLLP